MEDSVVPESVIESYSPLAGWLKCRAALRGYQFCLWRYHDVAFTADCCLHGEPVLQLNMNEFSVVSLEHHLGGFIITNDLHSFSFRAPTTEAKLVWLSSLERARTEPRTEPDEKFVNLRGGSRCSAATEDFPSSGQAAVASSPPEEESFSETLNRLKKRLRAMNIMSAFPKDGIPSVSCETLRAIRKLAEIQREEEWDREHPFLAEHPHLKNFCRIAQYGLRCGLIAGRLGLESSCEFVDSLANQYEIWKPMFEKEDFEGTAILSTAVLTAQLSGLIYAHLGSETMLKYGFEVLGHLFDFEMSSNPADLPFWALVLNKTENRLYLVFRGTDNVIDSLIDANAQLTTVILQNFEVRVHQGVYGVLNKKLEALRPLIYRCYERNGRNIGITVAGHSLGGSYAKLCYLLLLGDGVINPEHLECYTFGAPVVMAPPSGPDNGPNFRGWPGLMGKYENNVHNFVNRFDIISRALGNSVQIRLFEAIATLKGDLDVMAQYREVSHGTDFLFHASHYQPYGEYYFLYSEEKQTIMRMIKADNLLEKRIIITLPVTKAMRLQWLLSDHRMYKHAAFLTKYFQARAPQQS